MAFYGDEGPRFRGYLELCDSPWDGQVIHIMALCRHGETRTIWDGMGLAT